MLEVADHEQLPHSRRAAYSSNVFVKIGVVRRVLGIAALVACASPPLHAQSTAPQTARAQAPPKTQAPPQAITPPAPALPGAPVVLWDSLYDRGDYFNLRDAVNGWRGPETPATRYVRGLLAHAFNRPDQAISWLKPLVDSAAKVRAGTPQALTPRQRSRAVVALGQSYLRVYRYRESGDVYRAALRALNPTLDSATRASFRSAAALGYALRDVLPPRVSWDRPATLDSVANGGRRFSVRVRIDGTPIPEPLLVNETAALTSLDSTTAAAHHIRLLQGTVTARSIAGQPTEARIGVIPTLEIGPATISNVVTLVLRDTDLTVPETKVHVPGVVGFPVVSVLGRVAFTQDGQIALSSPGAGLIDTAAAAPLALYDAPMQDITPVVGASFGEHRIALTVSPRLQQTVLYSSFLSQLPDTRASARASARASGGDSVGSGLTAASVSPDTLHDVRLVVGGHTLHLPLVNAVPPPAASGAALYAGSLGADVLQQVDALAFDFGAMSARLVSRPPPPVLPTLSYTPGPPPAPAPDSVPRELTFIALLFALFIVPKALQRYKIPGAITSLVMGGVANAFGMFPDDPTLHLLSTLGIVALFLFAGLEIDGPEMRRNVSALTLHAAIWAALATATAVVAGLALGVTPRAAALLALALVTPSTGFILSSLTGFGLTTAEQRTVKTYAIGSELLALSGLFFVLQSTSLGHLALAIGAMAGVVILIPLAFRFFAAVVAPYAPRSEFAFLLMVAVVSAYATRRLGVYYLVGAFLVGVAAQRFRSDHPAMSSEKMVDALESFGSVFIPFYFFHAGTQIVRDQLTPRALLLGVLLVVVLVPIRVGVVAMHRRLALGESFMEARRVGSALVPTLVFTLVIVGILHDRFDLSNDIAGALVLYTVLNTTMPAFILRAAPADFEDPAARPVELLPTGDSVLPE